MESYDVGEVTLAKNLVGPRVPNTFDGGKALHAAIIAVFDHPVIQRCQMHYADLQFMPMWMGNPLQDRGFLLARSA